MKKLFLIVLTLAAMCSSLQAQNEYKAIVDSILTTVTPYNEYNTMRRSLFETLPICSDDIVFLGDSITDRCEWADLMENTNIKNRGISGDKVIWMFDRYEQIAKGYPKKLFFMGGVNDVRSGKIKAKEIIAMVAELLTRFREISPDTQIYVQSILPVNLSTPTNEKYVKSNLPYRIDYINAGIKKWCNEYGITYIDVASAFKNGENQMNMDLSFDGLHPNGKGYQIWKSIINNYVNEY